MAKRQEKSKPSIFSLRQELESTKTDVGTFNPAKELGETRSKIAKDFVRWYFILIAGAFILTLTYNLLILWVFPKTAMQQIISPKDILLATAGIMGSPLGFVVGYYFKDSQKQ